MAAYEFMSSIKYHFSLIFTNNKVFNKDTESLFFKSRRMRFSLEVLNSFETHFQFLILNRIVASTF